MAWARGWPSRALLLPLLLASHSLAQQSASDDKPVIGVVSVQRPDQYKGVYPAVFATFSAFPLPKDVLSGLVPFEDKEGCSRYILPQPMCPCVAIVRRGNCTFVEKALWAQQAGAVGLIVVFDDEEATVMGGNDTDGISIFAASMPHSTGGDLVTASLQGDYPMLTITPYKPPLLDPSSIVLVFMATALVAAGAFFSTSDLRQSAFSSAIAPPREEVLEVDTYLALGFCGVGSVFLLVLFFFMRYMIYFIIFAFCLGGASCITQFGSLSLQHFIPDLKKKACTVPFFGPLLKADVLAGIPALAVVASWLVLRNTHYGWPFQDIIGAGFLCWLQRTLRLPNMKIATILLCAMFFFDIFWVFLSPLIFQRSVMVTVATGGDTGESVPMLLRLPAMNDVLGRDRLLGFGDVALPGLLVSYLRRHDLMSHRKDLWRLGEGYFGPSLVGYFVGLCVTIAALAIMKMGQPALLYLVPGTLGTTLLLSLRRGELSLLWEGVPANRGSGSRVACADEGSDEPA